MHLISAGFLPWNYFRDGRLGSRRRFFTYSGVYPSPSTYAGSRRRGIRRPITNVNPVRNHIEQASKLQSRFPEPTPLPTDIRMSLEFLGGDCDGSISQFTKRRIGTLQMISEKTRPVPENRYLNTPCSIRSASGRADVALMGYRMRHLGMGPLVGYPSSYTDFQFLACLRMHMCIMIRLKGRPARRISEGCLWPPLIDSARCHGYIRNTPKRCG